MKRIHCFAGILLTAVFVYITPATAQITAVKTDAVIQLDGRLSEDAWNAVEPVTGFIQREMIEGAEPSERTELRIMSDEENLYIGIICYDREPGKIIHKGMGRDINLLGDDYITVIFDTYNDKRTGYYFSVNPNGSLWDGTFETGDEYANGNWDGIWDARAHMGDFGWSCEMVVPFKTLKFPATVDQTWGFNFRRKIRRRDELVLWRAWRQNEGMMMLSKAGTLNIPGPVEAGRQLDLRPYVLGGIEDGDGSDPENTFKYGLDAKYGITSNTTLDLTTNTDFAQIESDREVINLTRYSLSYPEKRPFFLEGSELFQFTQGMTDLFYTRNIGITPDRQQMPIIAGGKLTQKRNGFRLGVMSVQTESEDIYSSTNYTVARMKKDIYEQSYIGLIATSLYNDEVANQVIGADLVLRTNSFMGDKNFEVQSYLTGSFTDGDAQDNLAGRIFVSYPNDTISTFAVYHAIGKGFDTRMGFIRGKEPGVQQYMFVFDYTPRPALPFIRKLDFEPLYFNYYTDNRNNLISRTVSFQPIGFITDADDTFGIDIVNRYEHVEEAYGRMYGNDKYIPLVRHEWWQYEMAFRSSSRRPFTVNLSGQTGDFYNGTRDGADLSLALKPSPLFSVSADAAYNEIGFETKTFFDREYGGRLEMFFNTRTTLSTFIQYNNVTNRVNVNVRFHYIPKVGSDIYLVYNSLMDENEDYRTIQSAAMLKLNATVRF